MTEPQGTPRFIRAVDDQVFVVELVARRFVSINASGEEEARQAVLEMQASGDSCVELDDPVVESVSRQRSSEAGDFQFTRAFIEEQVGDDVAFEDITGFNYSVAIQTRFHGGISEEISVLVGVIPLESDGTLSFHATKYVSLDPYWDPTGKAPTSLDHFDADELWKPSGGKVYGHQIRGLFHPDLLEEMEDAGWKVFYSGQEVTDIYDEEPQSEFTVDEDSSS